MQGNQWLDRSVFKTVIASTPLVSIDLVVRNPEGEILLGLRTNRPASGFWFVPGGRIQKNETLAAAFERLTLVELGQVFSLSEARYLGLYEHFYEDSVFGNDPSTHYVVNAFELVVNQPLTLPQDQHNDYVWMNEQDLLASDFVHVHSKWYFQFG